MNMMDRAALWRGIAEQATIAAEGLHDADLRLQMLSIAAAYLALAKRAEIVSRSGPASKSEAAD